MASFSHDNIRSEISFVFFRDLSTKYSRTAFIIKPLCQHEFGMPFLSNAELIWLLSLTNKLENGGTYITNERFYSS